MTQKYTVTLWYTMVGTRIISTWHIIIDRRERLWRFLVEDEIIHDNWYCESIAYDFLI